MLRSRFDGSFQSANTPTYQNVGGKEDYALYRCIVLKAYFTDNKQNISGNAPNAEVLYDCLVLGGFSAGQLINSCRLSNLISGNNTYHERTLKSSTKDPSKVRLQDLDGDIVYVQHIQGHTGYPVIIGLASGNKPKYKGATKSQAPRLIEEFNGLYEEINNKGEYKLERRGGTLDSQEPSFKPNDVFEYKFEVLQNEVVKETFKSGLTITRNGKGDKLEFKTSGGVIATLDGKGNKINLKAGSTEIIIDGASGKIQLKGELVDLGASVSDFVTKFTELASAFATHTHQYLPGPGGPTPTTPPMAPLLTSVGSQTVKVQS